MNYLWAGMMLIGIIFASFNGTLSSVTEAALNSAKEAVTLCITMLGTMSLWMGLMKVAEKCGIIEGISNKLNPVLRFLFPNLPQKSPAKNAIATNMVANIFGLGWAATPAGLKAMAELQEITEEKKKNGKIIFRSKDTASKEMCNFLIINMSSLQLIPINVITYRGQYGSVEPAVIIGPAILATTCSTLIAVVFCKIAEKIFL